MTKSLKIILLAASGFVGLLVLVAVALLLFVDPNAYKPRLEAAASEALGMEVRVGGRLRIGFFSGLLLTLEDVHIRNQEADVVSAQEARLGIDLFPLLQKDVRIRKLALKYPRISIERDHHGMFNFEEPEAPGETLTALDFPKVSLSDGTLLYVNKQSGQGLESRDCHLDVHRLRLSAGTRSDLMKNLSFTAALACGEILTKDFAASDFKFSVAGKDGVFDLKPIVMRVFGGQGSASIRADFTGAIPLYQVRYSLSQFRIDEFLKILSPKQVAEGSMDFSTNLSIQGQTANEMTRSADGEAALRGEHLALDGIDLDQVLSRFESSQNFNLVDVGAFFFAGPLGLVVTKGYNFAGIFQGSGGRNRDQDARLPLEGPARRGAGAGCGHGDERTPHRPPGRARFRQPTVQ